MLDAIWLWFEMIKVYDGKQRNNFESNGKVFSVDESLEVIEENAKYYKDLKKGNVLSKGLWLG